MSGSTNVTATNMELTPQRVTWGGNDLGGTLENVQIDVEYSKGEIKADQFGTTVLDRRLNGIMVKVTTKLAEVRSTTTWAKVFPNAVTGSGAIEFRLDMGSSDAVQAQTLLLHPLALDDSDTSQDHKFYAAFPSEVSSIVYGPEEQSALQVIWNVYPYVTGGVTKWYRYGDQSVSIT